MNENTPPNSVSVGGLVRKSSMLAYIHDECDNSKGRQVEVKVKADCRGIYIQAKGYKTDFDDTPIMLEIWNNELRLIVWGEKDKEDPSQIISLENLRKKTKSTKK